MAIGERSSNGRAVYFRYCILRASGETASTLLAGTNVTYLFACYWADLALSYSQIFKDAGEDKEPLFIFGLGFGPVRNDFLSVNGLLRNTAYKFTVLPCQVKWPKLLAS